MYACTNGQGEITNSLSLKDSLQLELSRLHDTLLVSGYYVKYILDDSNRVYTHWGNQDFDRSYFYDYGIEDIHEYFKIEYKDYIGLHSWSGHFWRIKFLPKNNSDSIITFDYPICYDAKNDLIFWKEQLAENEYTISWVGGMENKRITLDSFPEFGFFMDGIDSVHFVDNGLFVRWKTELDFSENAKMKEQLFVIEF
ncbi:MAG: hypothetical protein GY810_05945 [Aureispira sp.]|nr:hypothetical protein [Aureispira sp.]